MTTALTVTRVLPASLVFLLGSCASSGLTPTGDLADSSLAPLAPTATAQPAEAAKATPAATATAQNGSDLGPEEGEWEFTLGGSGASDSDFDAGNYSLSGSVGKYLSEHSLLGIRQSGSYADFNGSVWGGSTRLFYDFHFGDGGFRPLIGANLGYVYGDRVKDTFAAAPEAGFKWDVTESAFVFLLAEYQFFFEDADAADDTFDDGSFVYTVGIGFHK